MGRIVQLLIAILLTLLVYRIYVALKRRSALSPEMPPAIVWSKAPWAWIVVSVLLLFVLQLVLGEIFSIDPDDFFFGGSSLLSS